MDMNVYLQKVINWCLSSGLHIFLLLILTLIALKAAKVLSRRFVDLVVRQKEDPEFRKRTQTLASVILYVSVFTILLVAAMMVLKEFGIEIAPILAAAGIAGLAVGFGAQSLVKDVISGFFILLEDQIRVGDVVQIAGKGGLVEKINLKTTILRDLSGNVHYVPNGHIDVVTNMTKDYSRYVFDIGVAYREDVDEVVEVIKAVDEELRKDPDYRDDILEPIEVLGLDQFANSAVVIRARTTTKPIKQWRVGREFNRRLKKKFDERNIEIPFPHMTLYMGEDKQGQSPPLRIVTEGK
jgi:moderate conductance mechanosensitive channel